MKFQFPVDEILFMPPFGAEDQDSDNSGDGQPNPQGNPQDSSKVKPNSDEGKGTPETPSDDDDDDEFGTYSTKELRRIARDLSSGKKTIEKERDSYKSKIDEQERKSRTEEENLRNDLKEAQDRNSVLIAANAKLAITNAIICDTRYEWHNPEIVAQQLNPDVVKVSDSGTVEGLKKELDRVSKEHAYLLKTKGGQPNTGRPTGFQPGQGGANSGGTESPDVKELAKTYPALASRM